MRVSDQSHALPALPSGKTRCPLYRRLGGSVWKGAKELALIGIRSPDRPARSQSLYELRRNCPLLTAPPTATCAPNPTQHNTFLSIQYGYMYCAICMLHVHPHFFTSFIKIKNTQPHYVCFLL